MAWIPIGPDFVAKFRRDDPKRLSRRNEPGRNGWVGEIAIHPTNADVIYVVERPSSGGTSVFRTRDGGRSWRPITDTLQQTDPHVDPSAIALNPSNPDIVYLGTYGDLGFYVSTDGGDTWGPRTGVGGRVRELVVDPNTAGTPATTRIYAATQQGLFRSADGGASWVELLDVDCVDIAADIPATGTPRFYVGAWRSGLHYSEDPETSWTNLNDQGIGLPAFVPSTGDPGSVDSFKTMRVDICARNPARAYVWLVKPQGPGNGSPYETEGIYTSDDPLTSWTKTASTSPNPGQGLYNFEFAVAPNSPGDGTADVLFIGNVGFHRSTDSGVSWTGEAIGFHADQQALAFFPVSPPSGTIPVLFRGDDGGLSRATRFCDPGFDFGTDPGHYNEADVYSDTGWFENLNHARQDVALYQHTSHPRFSALNYVGCQDTGVAGGPKALGWRSLVDADAGAIAIAPGTDGLVVWGIWGAFGGFPSFRMTRWVDDGDLTPVSTFVGVGAGGPLVNSTSNYELTPGDECLTGGIYRRDNGTLTAALTADAAPQEATPSDMTGIVIGSVIVVDPGGSEERVVVTATTATTFSAVFTMDHDAGVALFREEYRVLRTGQDAIASPISALLPWAGSRGATLVKLVAPHPADPDIVVCATGENRVWRTDTASTAGPGTAWNEIATDRPANADVVGLAVTVGGEVYALLRVPRAPAGGGADTPLYRLDGGAWEAQACTGNPANQGSRRYGKLVAHPGRDGDVFVAHGARVYRAVRQVTESGDEWSWTDISDGLPGMWVYDLWTGWVGTTPATRQALLRAAGPTRGVWELLPDAGKDDDVAPARRPVLHVRDHLLDQGIGPLETGARHPYDPTRLVRHYHCADLKVEGIQPSGTGPDYFQTDPEYSPLPIDHVAFDMLRDDRSQLGAGRPARLHVQVHNRSTVVANQVRVWTLYANAAAGVPGLNKSASSGDAFPFWSQFLPTGEIIPALPADSPWTAVGPPVTIAAISQDRPGIASWQWTVPTLSTGHAGHYCAVTFIHSSANPISETGFAVDDIARSNRQIGQKNLHVVTVGSTQRAYIEFHNPAAAVRTADLEFDFAALPPELEVSIQPTPLGPGDVPGRVTGIRAIRPATPEEREELKPRRRPWWARLLCWLRWLLWWVIRRLTGRRFDKLLCPAPRPLPEFDDVVYEAETGQVVRFPGIELGSHGFVAAMMRIHHRGGLPPGTTYHFEVRQAVGGQLRGGSGYNVVIAGDRVIPVRPDSPRDFDPTLTPEDRLDVPGAREEEKYIPETAKDLTRQDDDESR